MARNSNREQGPQSAGPRELSCDSEAFKSVEFLPQGDTINAVSYLQTLYNLRDAPHDKCPAKKKIMLQHNNARHHIVRLQGDRVQTNGRNVSTRRSGPSFHGLSSYARTAMCDRWGGPGRVVGYKLLNRSSTVTQGGRKHLRHFVLGQWTECTDLTAIRRFLYSYIMSNGLMSSTSCREGVCVCVCVCVCVVSITQCVCPVSYRHLWYVRLYSIFLRYLIKGMIFEKKNYWTQNVCSDFFYNFCLKHFTFWEELSEILSIIIVQRSSLPVKHPLILSDFHETWVFSNDFRKILKYHILWKYVQWKSSCPVQTDRQTDRHD